MGRRSQKGKQKKQASKRKGNFWNNEYANKDNFDSLDNVSGDLKKFFRWLNRQKDFYLPQGKIDNVLDLGCGDGGNLIHVCNEYDCIGLGYDMSNEAIKQANKKSEEIGTHIEFLCRTVDGDIPINDDSQKLVFDIMVSHFLNKNKRTKLMREIYRVLEPGGFLFF